ncbi:MAG: peptidyl-prolyl cis-trans isomerase [Candidatus Dependentiae bacterium]|nr:peptidyl-prolyl cis-trans isomerase [Candidatus Dependentiae bacterium]
MKLQKSIHKQVTGVALVALLAALPGCTNWFSGDKGTSKDAMSSENGATSATAKESTSSQDSATIVFIDGKPLITVKRLEKEKNDLMESNPQLKQMLPLMPAKQLDRNLAEGLTNQEVVAKYIADKKIDTSKEYLEEMERIQQSVKHMLNNKFFSQNLKAEVSDSEVKDFYDKKKNQIPQLLISQGGVKASGVQFNTAEKAQAFVAKINEHKGNLQKAADAAPTKEKVQNFNLVNEQSIGIDAQLRDKIVALKKVPTTEVIKIDDKTFWVVQATEKQEAKYQPFEAIKAELAKHLEQKKHEELLEAEVKKLHDTYKITFNEEYFVTGEPSNGVQGQDELQEISQE